MIRVDTDDQIAIESIADIRAKLFKLAPSAVKTIQATIDQKDDPALAFAASRWVIESLMDDPELTNKQSNNLLVLAQALTPPVLNNGPAVTVASVPPVGMLPTLAPLPRKK